MCGVLDEAEARGKWDLLYKQIKKGRITLEEAASDVEMTIKLLLDSFKEYKPRFVIIVFANWFLLILSLAKFCRFFNCEARRAVAI